MRQRFSQSTDWQCRMHSTSLQYPGTDPRIHELSRNCRFSRLYRSSWQFPSQTIPTILSRSPLADHLGNDAVQARVSYLAGVIAIAGTIAVVALHQAWVAHAIVIRWYADATAGFLYHDGEAKRWSNLVSRATSWSAL